MPVGLICIGASAIVKWNRQRERERVVLAGVIVVVVQVDGQRVCLFGLANKDKPGRRVRTGRAATPAIDHERPV